MKYGSSYNSILHWFVYGGQGGEGLIEQYSLKIQTL